MHPEDRDAWHRRAGEISDGKDDGALVEELRRRVPPYVTRPNGEAVPSEPVWRRAVTPEGELWFFCSYHHIFCCIHRSHVLFIA